MLDLRKIVVVLFTLYIILFYPKTVLAISDPLSVPNNKYGIHIISATSNEIKGARDLVNSSGGEWGYITVLIENKDRDKDKWQNFFNELRREHLIPLVRIATQPQGSYWKVPEDGEAEAWADFLDKLNWPVKNRYIIIYNEPNQGQEWAGIADPASYAKVLDKTIDALKNKNEDFFILNAGFDASAPQKTPLYFEEAFYLREMEKTIPGIFNKLDGWVSHSYPNPGFVGSPDGNGRGSVRTYLWEKEFLKGLGVTKNLPVFITETGWKHAEGLNFEKSLPTADTVADYYKKTFQNAWNNNDIVAVTPFLLDYQEAPFDHFSFNKPTGDPQNVKILGASYPEYYPQYEAIVNLPKTSGQPLQENKASMTKGIIYSSIVTSEQYSIPLTFKNEGQSIWNDKEPLSIRFLSGEIEMGLRAQIPTNKVEPGQSITTTIHLQSKQAGTAKISFQLYSGNTPFENEPLEFTVQSKSPVILIPKVFLEWKNNFSGEYLLSVKSDFIKNTQKVLINNEGLSQPLEAKFLLPDYTFQFTIQKGFYKPKTISLKVSSGDNILDFGKLEPDLLSAMLSPADLWNLLPFSN